MIRELEGDSTTAFSAGTEADHVTSGQEPPRECSN